MASLNYPAWVITRQDKWAYLCRARKLIQKLRNAMCKWNRDGISASMYSKLPAIVKARYPFIAGVKLSSSQLKDYLYGWAWGYDSVFDILEDKLLELQGTIENDNTIDVDLERDISA